MMKLKFWQFFKLISDFKSGPCRGRGLIRRDLRHNWEVVRAAQTQSTLS